MPFFSCLPLVLASASPRRSDLLASAGLAFEIRPSHCPEPEPEPGESAEGYALRMARIKAADVAFALAAELAPNPATRVILAADTVVAIHGRILGKPANRVEVRAMLNLLCRTSGAPVTHLVATGCCLLRLDENGVHNVAEYCVATDVDMGPAPEAAIDAYARSKEPLDKAGGYAIQGQGGFLARAIRGSYSNVVGLPLAETLDALLACKAIEAAVLSL